MNDLFVECFERISDRKFFPYDFWFLYPDDPKIAEFVEWYHKETKWCIQFSEGKTHFRVVFPLSKAESDRLLSMMPARRKKEIPKYVHPKQKQDFEKREIPIFGSRPDISMNVMKKFGLKPSQMLIDSYNDFMSKKESKNTQSVFDCF